MPAQRTSLGRQPPARSKVKLGLSCPTSVQKFHSSSRDLLRDKLQALLGIPIPQPRVAMQLTLQDQRRSCGVESAKDRLPGWPRKLRQQPCVSGQDPTTVTVSPGVVSLHTTSNFLEIIGLRFGKAAEWYVLCNSDRILLTFQSRSETLVSAILLWVRSRACCLRDVPSNINCRMRPCPDFSMLHPRTPLHRSSPTKRQVCRDCDLRRGHGLEEAQ